jgi:8-oxo-dGTP pyrophosphatase MutT (NUDIX family)
MRTEEVLLVVYRPAPPTMRQTDAIREFLVLLRSPERHGYWNLVAGGVEEGETASAAARRELLEESGLGTPTRFEPLPLELGYVRPEGSKVVVHGFLAAAPQGWEPVLDEEHVEYRWCSPGDADDLLAYPEPREAVAFVARLLAEEAC